MDFKNRLLSNIFLRNVLADFGLRTTYSTKAGGFTPYFQYKIGPYESDYYLYFEKEPFAKRYKNEIFNKLFAYEEEDEILAYLTFHYNGYPDQHAFLQFLQYTIAGRLRRKPSAAQKNNLQCAQDWVAEKISQYRALQEAATNQVSNSQETDQHISAAVQKIIPPIEKLLEGYVTGNIRITNQKYLPLIIQLFYTLQNLTDDKKNHKAGDKIFSSFSSTDLAFILRLHFADFKDKQPNTIQKEITKTHEAIDTNSEKFKRLNKALREFFFD